MADWVELLYEERNNRFSNFGPGFIGELFVRNRNETRGSSEHFESKLFARTSASFHENN